MNRGAPLRRRTPLRSGKPLAGKPFGAPKPVAEPQEHGIKPKRPKDTGPDRRTRDLVLARDNFCCVACGKPVGGACTWWSLQHRLARGQGGGSEAWNLISMCGSATTGCHSRAESRDREFNARGYWLESWQDPRAEAVLICGEQSGIAVWLDDLGNYLDEDGNVLTGPGRAA